MSDNNKPPIVKQLLGAGVGATIALALYAGYQVAAPNVLAYINVHRASQDEARFSSRSLDEEDRQMERQQQRNREIARAHDAPVIQGSNASDVFDTIAERVKEIEEELVQEETKEAEEADGTEEITEEIIEPVSEPVEPVDVSTEWEEELEASEHVAYEGTEELPDSGIGLWTGVVVALLLAAYTQRKRFIAYFE